MNVSALQRRLIMIERVFSSTHMKVEQRTHDTRVLSLAQRQFCRDVARMIMTIRKGDLEWTDERIAVAQDAKALLDACPPLPKVMQS